MFKVYDEKALLYAEKYGIIDYKVYNDEMVYYERFYNEGTYKVVVNLDTKKETRKKL